MTKDLMGQPIPAPAAASNTVEARVAHTPGPWLQSRRKQPHGDYITQVYDATGETIANIAWYPVKLDDATLVTARGPNARLIAAAPDLLAAAKRAKTLLEPELVKEPDRTVFWELVDAIAKAEGRS